MTASEGYSPPRLNSESPETCPLSPLCGQQANGLEATLARPLLSPANNHAIVQRDAEWNIQIVQPEWQQFKQREAEWQKREAEWEKRLHTMELWLKMVSIVMVSLTLFSWASFYSLTSESIVSSSGGIHARLRNLEHQVQSRQSAWSSHDFASLSARYTALETQHKKTHQEIEHEISRLGTKVDDAIASTKRSLQVAFEDRWRQVDQRIKQTSDEQVAFKDRSRQLDQRMKQTSDEQVAFKDRSRQLDQRIKQTSDDISRMHTEHRDIVAEQQHHEAVLSNLTNSWSADVASKISHANSQIDQLREWVSALKSDSSNSLAQMTNTKVLIYKIQEMAQSAIAGIKGVGFVMKQDGSCPTGSSRCVLWHWMSPELGDPYCGSQRDATASAPWSAGECGPGMAGELENKMYGCCRND